MENLYRRYKIYQITNNGITSVEKEIVEFILDKIKDLTIFEYEFEYGTFFNHCYMNNDGSFVFSYSEKEKYLWICHVNFYNTLKYSIVGENNNGDGLLLLIETLIYDKYKLDIEKTNIRSTSKTYQIEKEYRKMLKNKKLGYIL
jgi:hypothetical protein